MLRRGSLTVEPCRRSDLGALARLGHGRSGGLPGGLGSAPGSTAWKIGSSASVLTLKPSPWMIRRTGRNRFGHELARTPVANPRRRRWPRLRPDLPSSLLTPRTGRRPPGPPGEPPHGPRSDDGVAGAQRLVAPRHATVGKTVRERSDRRRRRFATDAPATWLSTRCSRSGGSISRRRHRSARARTSRFSVATNRSEVPAHTVVASPRCACEPTLRTC
jgi:hypothetical protein